MKTILVCSNVYPPNAIGGAELIAHYQAKVLQQRAYKVIVFAGDHAPDRERHSIRRADFDGPPVFRISLHPQDWGSEFINFSKREVEFHFESLLDAFSPDIVHMHNIIGLSAGIIHIAKQKGIRTVVTLHDHWGFCFKNTLLKKGSEVCRDYTRCAECMPLIGETAEKTIPIRMRQDFLKLLLSDVDVFISPSLYLAETYVRAGIPIGKIKLIWYGIDVRRLSQVTKKPGNGRVRFTFIGHFGLHKGIDVLLDALFLVHNRDGVSLNLVGQGELMDHVRERVKALSLSAVVRFWGKVDNREIEEVLSETDVQILPSIWPENQPVTITEAMATRTPVIASAIGGIPELVIDAYNGYLFQPGSAVELAAKMSQFIAHPERIKVLGDNAFETVREKSFEHQVDQICAAYG